jgi:hypothetical protein
MPGKRSPEEIQRAKLEVAAVQAILDGLYTSQRAIVEACEDAEFAAKVTAMIDALEARANELFRTKMAELDQESRP